MPYMRSHAVGGVEDVDDDLVDELLQNPEGDSLDDLPPNCHVVCDVVICDVDELPETRENPRKQIDPKLLNEVRKLVISKAERLFSKNHLKRRLPQLMDVPTKYNNRITRRLGVCYVRRARPPEGRRPRSTMFTATSLAKAEPYLIEVAGKIDWPRDMLREVLIHEYCHGAIALLARDYPDEDSHGPKWRALAEACGIPAESHCVLPDKLSKQLDPERHKRKLQLRTITPVDRYKLRVGDIVYFYDREGEVQAASVQKLNPTTAKVLTPQGLVYRVKYAALSSEPPGDVKDETEKPKPKPKPRTKTTTAKPPRKSRPSPAAEPKPKRKTAAKKAPTKPTRTPTRKTTRTRRPPATPPRGSSRETSLGLSYDEAGEMFRDAEPSATGAAARKAWTSYLECIEDLLGDDTAAVKALLKRWIKKGPPPPR